MGKRLNPNLAKIHRNYMIEEVASLFGVHKNTVRQWVKGGLPICDEKKPMLILGSVLRQFLQNKRVKNKHKMQPYEFFCMCCKSPQRPAENMVEYEMVNSSRGRLRALCPTCANLMNKYISIGNLTKLQSELDITIPKVI